MTDLECFTSYGLEMVSFLCSRWAIHPSRGQDTLAEAV